jgi:hypothetical protein
MRVICNFDKIHDPSPTRMTLLLFTFSVQLFILELLPFLSRFAFPIIIACYIR